MNKKANKSTLVIWDFDWSLINENSDTYILQVLQSGELYDELCTLRKKMQWTDLMNHMMIKLTKDRGVTKEEIYTAFQDIPVFDEIASILKEIQDSGGVNVICSDANTIFIDYILKAKGLSKFFNGIWTNFAHFEKLNSDPLCSKEVLKVSPYVPRENPHDCTRCSINLCKGNVLEKYFYIENYSTVVYVGDGGGDVCPCIKLRSGDAVLARKDYPLDKKIAKLQKEHYVSADVFTWSNGVEMKALFTSIIN